MALGKKIRFEILKRDGHTCRYCGGKPPHVTLEVDHVIARAQGGTDQPENLVASCFDCNRGKGKNGLGASILIARDLKAEKKARRIAKQLMALDAEKEAAIQKNIETMCLYLEVTWGVHSDIYNPSDFRYIASKLRPAQVSDAASAVDRKMSKEYQQDRQMSQNDILKYFCGVCHNKIKFGDR